MKTSIINRNEKLKLAIALLLIAQVIGMVFASRASAATLTDTYLRLNRMKSGENTSVRLVFKAVSSQTANVTVNFDGTDTGTSEWTDATKGGVVNATQTVATATCATETGFTALPGSISASGSSATVTIASVGATTSGTTYCVDLTSASAVTNPTSTGEYHPTITIGTDSVTTALRIIGDDEIDVSAVVPPSFTFALDANSTSFTQNLDSGNIRSTTGRTVTITTNASKGWIVWARSANAGLTSSAASKTINTTGTINGATSTLSAGTEGYVLDVDLTTDSANGGTVDIDNEYDGGASAGGTFSTSFQPLATSNGTAGGSGDVITLVGKAAIAGDTPAASDYADTWTVIGAGNY
jgi:hypothetical protein